MLLVIDACMIRSTRKILIRLSAPWQNGKTGVYLDRLLHVYCT